MKGALVAGAVAEEADGHPIVALQPAAQRGTYGHGDGGAEDARLAQDADAEICQVHGAALALADASLLAQQLRHSGLDVPALGDGVAMGAVITGHPVVVAQGHAGTDGDRFLADIGMGRADDFAAFHQIDHCFFEVSNPKHAPHHLH